MKLFTIYLHHIISTKLDNLCILIYMYHTLIYKILLHIYSLTLYTSDVLYGVYVCMYTMSIYTSILDMVYIAYIYIYMFI